MTAEPMNSHGSIEMGLADKNSALDRLAKTTVDAATVANTGPSRFNSA